MAAVDDRRSGPDPEGFERCVADFLEWLRVSAHSERTVFDRRLELSRFVSWCADRGLTRPSEVTKPILERYQSAIFYHRKPNGKPLALNSQRSLLGGVQVFFRWLARRNRVLYNPASDLLLPKQPRRLPRHVLTEEEVERVINAPDVSTPLGLRDRAILETLYSTGIRRKEITALCLYDLDAGAETLMVREGKGRKDRVVPIGARAVSWVEKYLAEVRPRLVVPPDEGYLFLTTRGGPFADVPLSRLVHDYIQAAGVKKPGGAHLFRHTCATLMLEHGADVRYVQEMLGHAQLSTTAIYTQVSIKKLKEVHTATHPAGLSRAHAEGDGERGAAPASAPAPEAAGAEPRADE